MRRLLLGVMTCLVLAGCGAEFSTVFSLPVGEGGISSLTGTSDPTRVWATTTTGTVITWDGKTWDESPQLSLRMHSAFALSADDVWLAGGDSALWRKTETGWSRELSKELVGDDTDAFYGVFGSGPDDLWVGSVERLLLHFDGAHWSSIVDRLVIRDLNGATGTRDNVWAIGPGFVARWNGTDWKFESPPEENDWTGLSVLAPDAVWVSGGHSSSNAAGKPSSPPAIYRWNGAVWEKEELPAEVGQDDGVVWIKALSPQDVWAALERGGLLHFDGSRWTRHHLPDSEGGSEIQVGGIWSFSAQDVWAGYANGLIHFDGTEWKRVDSGTGAWSAGPMWGATDGELFVAVNGMILEHEPSH